MIRESIRWMYRLVLILHLCCNTQRLINNMWIITEMRLSKLDEELSLETNRQIVEDWLKMKWIRFQKQFLKHNWTSENTSITWTVRMHTENQSEELTAVFTQEADYLQKRRLSDLKISWNQLSKYLSYRVLFRLIMLFLLSRDYMTVAKDQKRLASVWHDANPDSERRSFTLFGETSILIQTMCIFTWVIQSRI